jgi:hypothetical protein
MLLEPTPKTMISRKPACRLPAGRQGRLGRLGRQGNAKLMLFKVLKFRTLRALRLGVKL